MTRSEELFERAQRVTPGGVHSPVRAFNSVGGTPRFIQSAHGSRLTDVDGNTYVDFCMAFGPLILGHAHPGTRVAVEHALAAGWSYGAAEALSLQLAECITGNVDGAERIRFVNSGTEAVMTALRLARAVTGRDLLLKFDGCYHGHTDAMLIRAGSGLAGAATPDSAGVPDGVAADTLIAPLDDDDALERIFNRHGDQIAAAIIEPVPANCGLLPQRHEFIEKLAQLCRSHRALLIFDEIITGFRLAFGGYAEVSGIRPDLVTWGKIIGGGFPVGAVAGAAALMDELAPAGPVYQAGTLSANPAAMAAGHATLERLLDGSVYARLETLGRELDTELAGIPGLKSQRVGSMFWLIPGCEHTDVTLRARSQVPQSIRERYRPLFERALEAGIYLPPSPHEVGFLSAAHTDEDIADLAAICD